MSKLFMSKEDIQRLLEMSKHTPRDCAFLHMALATGFRVSDLLSLKRDDVVPVVGGNVVKTLKIKMRKTGKMVERALPKECRSALDRYLGTRIDDNPYLFYSESNNSQNRKGPMNRASIHRIIKGYLAAMYEPEKVKGNACHVTRRSMAQLISVSAGRIEPASRFLGHSSLASTASYVDMDAYARQADDIVGNMPWNAKG